MANFLKFLILGPIAIVLVLFAIANRQWVPVSINPFSRADPTLTLEAPLYMLMFGAMMIGVVLGGLATWLKQRPYRKVARLHQRQEARAAKMARRQEDDALSYQQPNFQQPALPPPSAA